MILHLCTLPDHALYLCQVSEKYLERISEFLNGHKKLTKGHNSVQKGGRVTVLVLCTLSDDVLYLYQVWLKYLLRF